MQGEGDQLLGTVTVQIGQAKAGVAVHPQQLDALYVIKAVDPQGVVGGGDLPGDHHLLVLGAAYIFVGHRADGAAHPLDDAALLIGVVLPQTEHIDLQRPLRPRNPEKGHGGLLHPVAVQVLELDGLGVGPRLGRDGLPADGGTDLADDGVEVAVVLRRLGEGKHIAGLPAHAAGQPQQNSGQQ